MGQTTALATMSTTVLVAEIAVFREVIAVRARNHAVGVGVALLARPVIRGDALNRENNKRP